MAAGLVARTGDANDHRVVRLHLTHAGEQKLAALASAHLEELGRLQRRLASLWRDLPEATAETSRRTAAK